MRENSTPPYLLVYDNIKMDDKKHEYTLNLHTGSENEVTVSGKNVFNFSFDFPKSRKKATTTARTLAKVTADGKLIKVVDKGGTWRADTPFCGNEVLTW